MTVNMKRTIAAALAAVTVLMLCACGSPKKSEYSADDFTMAVWVQTRENNDYEIDSGKIEKIVELFNEAECVGYADEDQNFSVGYGVGLNGDKSLTVCQYEGNKFYVTGDGSKAYIIESAELCEYLEQLILASK